MGSFGGAVSSLLDTYTKCLAFLKDFNRGRSSSESTSELQSSLRKARSSVRRDYSSRLSHDGRPFEKGDAASKSSLKRVIRKLTSTLASLCASPRRDVALDYGSLVSLCDRSEADAMRTMSDLSSRISTRSRSTIRSKPSSSTKSRRSGQPGRGGRSRRSKGDADLADARRQLSGASRGSKHGHRHASSSHDKRVSMMTMSSNSTKLGEIRRRGDPDPRVSVAYPRRLHKEKVFDSPEDGKKKWWKIF